MHQRAIDSWQHDHAFGTNAHLHGEQRTRWVVALTAVMMVLEIAAGIAFGSMALLADGWHMATHAAALGVAAFAYAYMRRHASDRRYSFGTGKVAALAGFASAVGLAVVALLVLAESAERLTVPVVIRYNEAIAVACLGLAVNVVSAWLLRDQEHGSHEPAEHHHDHNLRGAYLHVLADALTSVLAIVALVAGKALGWSWMDSVTGIVGSVVIARWSWSLLRDTSRVLLDAEVSEHRSDLIRRAIESDADNRVADLHLWRVGPRHVAAIVSVVTHDPRDPAHYKRLLVSERDLVHVTVEVQTCAGGSCAAA
jgi:cation diffusion facilitator family transporter